MNFNSKNGSTAEIIKLMMAKKNVTISELARSLNESRQNLHKKFKNSSFSEQDIYDISNALGYEVMISFIEKKEE